MRYIFYSFHCRPLRMCRRQWRLPEPLCDTFRARYNIPCVRVGQTFYSTGTEVPLFEIFAYECGWLTCWKCFLLANYFSNRSRWPCRLRRFAAARLLGLWVRISLGIWMSVSCQCSVLSRRGFCYGPMPHPGESYRVGVCH